MMSVCNDPNCQSTQNIWTISNDNTSPPFYKAFNICNVHLEDDERYKEMHKALVMGRFNNQCGNRVTYKGWTLQKKVATWKQNNTIYKCSECNRIEKIWGISINVKVVFDDENDLRNQFNPHRRIHGLKCDEHMLRNIVGENPGIFSNDCHEGIITQEESWTINEAQEIVSKKRGRSELLRLRKKVNV